MTQRETTAQKSKPINRWFYATMGVRSVPCRALADGSYQICDLGKVETLDEQAAKSKLRAERVQTEFGGGLHFLNATECADLRLSSV